MNQPLSCRQAFLSVFFLLLFLVSKGFFWGGGILLKSQFCGLDSDNSHFTFLPCTFLAIRRISPSFISKCLSLFRNGFVCLGKYLFCFWHEGSATYVFLQIRRLEIHLSHFVCHGLQTLCVPKQATMNSVAGNCRGLAYCCLKLFATCSYLLAGNKTQLQVSKL